MNLYAIYKLAKLLKNISYTMTNTATIVEIGGKIYKKIFHKKRNDQRNLINRVGYPSKKWKTNYFIKEKVIKMFNNKFKTIKLDKVKNIIQDTKKNINLFKTKEKKNESKS